MKASQTMCDVVKIDCAVSGEFAVVNGVNWIAQWAPKVSCHASELRHNPERT